MSQLPVIFRRELGSYFATPLAYVFIVIFLVLSGVFTFYLGGFYERGQADLTPFFSFHTWLYLFLVPAIAMRLWAEERKSGSIELLMTLPITRFEAVAGKFLAAWVFAGIALLLTFPMVITVNYLGEPDNGVIVAGYLGSWLLAGAFWPSARACRRWRKPGDRLHPLGGGVLPVHRQRSADGARRSRLGAAVADRRGGFAELPDPFRLHQQGRDRPA